MDLEALVLQSSVESVLVYGKNGLIRSKLNLVRHQSVNKLNFQDMHSISSPQSFSR